MSVVQPSQVTGALGNDAWMAHEHDGRVECDHQRFLQPEEFVLPFTSTKGSRLMCHVVGPWMTQ